MKGVNENGLSFKFTISDAPYASFPEFYVLGRDNPYMLNVKLVDKDGTPVSGVKYKITTTNDGAHLVIVDRVGVSCASSPEGENFLIEGLPATTEADLKNMQYAFSVDCETEEDTDKVIGHLSLRMGRLLRWGRPGISANANPAKAIFSTKTERVGKESTVGARWDWGERVSVCVLKVGNSIEGSGGTSPGGNSDGSFRATPEIDLAKFSNLTKATLQFEGGLSDDQFTAVLPSTEPDVELYYFQSVAFSKPSVIVGVPAEVTCKLMGLDQKPRANVDVEWATTFGALQPATSKTDAQGVAKTACTATDAGNAEVTVLSTAHRMIRATSVAVPVGPLVIVDPVASATQYIEGHSPAIKFSVTLQAAGQPVSGLTVEWFVGDSLKGTSVSDDAGKATRDLTFTAGQNAKQVVRARVSDTQVQTTFDVNVYAVVITRQEPATPEYIIGHTGNIAFSVWLEAAGKAPPSTAVEWFVDGVKKDPSSSDSSGKATQNLGFSTPGDHKVTAKIGHSSHSVDFTVTANAVEMENPVASTNDYVIGYSPDVDFSVILSAGGKPLPNVKVEWQVAGIKVGESTTNASGKAIFKTKFESPGDFTITVKEPKSELRRNVTVKAIHVTIASRDPTTTIDYVKSHSSDVTFKVWVKAGDKPQEGAKVEWFIDPTRKPSSYSDKNGLATCTTDFGVVGQSRKMIAKLSSSGETVDFLVNVNIMEMVKMSSTTTEYIVGHSPDVIFSVKLKAGEKVQAGIEIEWLVDGVTVKNKTDNYGMATLNKKFDSVGTFTVTAKETKSKLSAQFTVNADIVSISDKDPKQTIRYVLRHSEDPTFTVWLRAHGKPLPNAVVRWDVDGVGKGSPKTDSTGKSTLSLPFGQTGSRLVKATATASGKSEAFNVSVVEHKFLITSWTADDSNAHRYLKVRENLRFRYIEYLVYVKVVDQNNNGVSGIPFTMRVGDRLLDAVSEAGVITLPWLLDSDEVSATSRLKFESPLADTLEQTYKPGWLIRPDIAWLENQRFMIVDMRVAHYSGLPKVYPGSVDDWLVEMIVGGKVSARTGNISKVGSGVVIRAIGQDPNNLIRVGDSVMIEDTELDSGAVVISHALLTM